MQSHTHTHARTHTHTSVLKVSMPSGSEVLRLTVLKHHFKVTLQSYCYLIRNNLVNSFIGVCRMVDLYFSTMSENLMVKGLARIHTSTDMELQYDF